MHEVLSEAVRPINLPFTVLLAVVVVYWLLVAVGVCGLDHEGGDLHAGDGAVHLDGHHPGDDGALPHGDASVGWFSSLLHFVNVGEVPVTIVGSVFALCLWLGSMVTNHYWTGSAPGLGLVALVPNLLLSAVVTRYLTMPFKPLLRAMNRDGDEHTPIVGRTCEITTSEANAQFGQARIETKGAPVLLNVRVRNSTALPRGASCLVVEEQHGVYYVVPVTSEKID